MTSANAHDRDHDELLSLHAVQALAPSDAVRVEAHLAECDRCRGQMQQLRATVASFAGWPTDLLRPAASLWDRIAARIGAAAGSPPAVTAEPASAAGEWQQPGPGITCRLLASDARQRRVSMLVRLAPGADYPPHRHAGTEELYLLDGELWIDDRKLVPGDYNRAEAGTSDRRVWSGTGCMCLLVTSPDDVLA